MPATILKLGTLTPLWTGGMAGTTDRIHETGIIGSLRWWYEAILRGLGGTACAAVSDPHCPRKVKVGTSEQNVRCLACDLFGCTGWGRRFRLRLASDGTPVFEQRSQGDQLNIRPAGRTRGWYYGAGRVGAADDHHIDGQLVVLRGDHGEVINQLLVTLGLINAWGAMGARTQHGFGVVNTTIQEDSQRCATDVDRFLSYIETAKAEHANAANVSNAPRLDEFFFAKFRFILMGQWWTRVDGLSAVNPNVRRWIDTGSVPVAPAIKNQLRFGAYLASVRSDRALENELFGALSPRSAAKIHVSSAYPLRGNKWEVRIWGWIPHSVRMREQVLNELHTALTQSAIWNRALGVALSDIDHEWREQGSPSRCQPPCPGPLATTADYLRCLLEGAA